MNCIVTPVCSKQYRRTMNDILTRCFLFISANISFKTEACSCKYSIARNSLQLNFEFKKPQRIRETCKRQKSEK